MGEAGVSNSRDGAPTGSTDEHRDPPWWDFIGYRRRFMSDRAWFGLALLAAGVGNVNNGDLAWLSLIAIPGGLLLLVLVVRRFWARAEDAAEAHDRQRQGHPD